MKSGGNAKTRDEVPNCGAVEYKKVNYWEFYAFNCFAVV